MANPTPSQQAMRSGLWLFLKTYSENTAQDIAIDELFTALGAQGVDLTAAYENTARALEEEGDLISPGLLRRFTEAATEAEEVDPQ